MALSSNYTFGHSKTVTASHASRTVHNSAAFLLPHLQPSMSLLDIGCGPGTITIGFAPYLSEGHIIGADTSLSVIAEAAKLADSQGLSNVSFQIADVFSLPFEDDTFDVVYAHQMFPHLPRQVDALKEMRRVTKPGGMVATRDAISMTWYPALPGLELFNTALSRLVASSGASYVPAGRKMHAWAREAGFERDKMTIGAGGNVYSTDDERRWWAGVMVGRFTKDEKYQAGTFSSGTSEEEVEVIVRDLGIWAEERDGWYGLHQAENIYRK